MSHKPMLSASHSPPDPNIFKLTGTTPGQLDPAQAERLLRLPGSQLLFASFNPRTASSRPEDIDFKKLSINEALNQGKRVVVELTPTGESYWRFVPKAQRDEGVLDEGTWPRIIELCGHLVECSQDQWDIYKLDPLYECRVRAPPALSTISRIMPKVDASMQDLTGKRSVQEDSSQTAQDTFNARKKFHGDPGESSDEDDEFEVEEMVIDDDVPNASIHVPGMTSRAKRLREEINKNRKDRREKMSRHAEKLAQQDEFYQFTQQQKTPTPGGIGKRKAPSLYRPFDEENREEEILRSSVNYTQTKNKRTRTASPSSARRDLEAKRLEREKQKRARRQSEAQDRRQRWHDQFMGEVYAEAFVNGHANDYRPTAEEPIIEEEPPSSESVQPEEDEEAVRTARLAESRRKMEELERDRPLWEEAARQRTARERAETEAQQQRAEERKRAEARARADADRLARAESEAREEALRRERAEKARLDRERRQRQQRYSHGPWTVHRALERYKTLSEMFDTTKFTENNPVSFDTVPWPVLTSPVSLSVEDIDWQAVETFFTTARLHMRSQDFKTFVIKSHTRFHPDRWSSRGILKSLVDEAERGCLEVAANTVSQALTPLRNELVGR